MPTHRDNVYIYIYMCVSVKQKNSRIIYLFFTLVISTSDRVQHPVTEELFLSSSCCRRRRKQELIRSTFNGPLFFEGLILYLSPFSSSHTLSLFHYTSEGNIILLLESFDGFSYKVLCNWPTHGLRRCNFRPWVTLTAYSEF